MTLPFEYRNPTLEFERLMVDARDYAAPRKSGTVSNRAGADVAIGDPQFGRLGHAAQRSRDVCDGFQPWCEFLPTLQAAAAGQSGWRRHRRPVAPRRLPA